jgi:hypothetical protein
LIKQPIEITGLIEQAGTINEKEIEGTALGCDCMRGIERSAVLTQSMGKNLEIFRVMISEDVHGLIYVAPPDCQHFSCHCACMGLGDDSRLTRTWQRYAYLPFQTVAIVTTCTMLYTMSFAAIVSNSRATRTRAHVDCAIHNAP